MPELLRNHYYHKFITHVYGIIPLNWVLYIISVELDEHFDILLLESAPLYLVIQISQTSSLLVIFFYYLYEYLDHDHLHANVHYSGMI